ncbi:MAG: hypothetical protein NC924_09045 [Candidatus Omnitrophica bacterium]|nr:hypothetical protein [Candidatus Omnitrophota bacterium]
MSRELSPEKRLLKIIEEQQDKPPVAVPSGRHAGGFFGTMRRLSVALPVPLRWWSAQTTIWDIHQVNGLLQALVVIAAVALAISAYTEIRQLNVAAPALPAMTAEVVAVPAATLQSRQFYLDKIRKRDLFSLADRDLKKLTVFTDGQEEPSRARELIADLKLVGISWSEDPDAIIEAERAQKTFFVKRGYQINDIEVKDILKDRVVLRVEGNEVDLR